MPDFYVLRYLPHVDLKYRRHDQTLGRFPTWADAEDVRLARPAAELLEVLPREATS